MKIRKATIEDREIWDNFVDSQNGDIHHYFDWKYVVESGRDNYIQLLIETGPSKIIGTFPVVKKNRQLYSALFSWTGSGGPLIKKDLSKEEKYLATKIFLQYLDTNYSEGCSSSKLMQMIPPNMNLAANPIQPILDCGYRLRYDKATGLPCSFVLELKPPFKQNIWMGLWSQKFRQALRKVEKSGVSVIKDEEMRYAESFIELLASTYRRHRITPPPREEVLAELQIFKDKTKLFVALKENVPVVVLCCHYTPSTCYLWQVGSATKDTNDINKYTYKIAIENACNSGYQFVDFGTTLEPGLASLKERFRGSRIPMRTYEKRYSIPRSIIELTPLAINKILHNKNYLWYHRHRIWDAIFHW